MKYNTTPVFKLFGLFGLVLVFNTTFNSVSFILWQSILMVEETGVAEENHQPVASH